jgi:hypothetical protein
MPAAVKAGVALEPWATGGCGFLVDEPGRGGERLLVSIPCRVDGCASEWALLDTGATWSVIPGDLLERATFVKVFPNMEQRYFGGVLRGPIVGVPIALQAERGHDIVIDSRVLAAQGYTGPIVLGYRGLLEQVAFLLNPGLDAERSGGFQFGSPW